MLFLYSYFPWFFQKESLALLLERDMSGFWPSENGELHGSYSLICQLSLFPLFSAACFISTPCSTFVPKCCNCGPDLHLWRVEEVLVTTCLGYGRGLGGTVTRYTLYQSSCFHFPTPPSLSVCFRLPGPQPLGVL